MKLPPNIIVQAAEDQASLSPCAKSKRGAVVFSMAASGAAQIFSAGFNGPPAPTTCAASDRCRAVCGKICAHAESRSLRSLLTHPRLVGMTATARAFVRSSVFDLLHVKLGVDGRVVAGGPPNCEQCSVAILDVGLITGVWLYEAPTPAAMETWDRLCKGDSVAGSSNPSGPPEAAWRRYSALEFHQATLVNRGLAVT
jgi:deoxycytidylate deaminase